MRSIEYTQIWPMELWLTSYSAESLMKKFFKESPEISWLQQEGYKPSIFSLYNHQTENVEVTMSFKVPDEIVTYLMLRFIDNETEMDIDE